MTVATPTLRSCDPARKSKSDYAAGFTNKNVASAWGRSPSLVSHKWEPFCESLLAVYRGLGRQRLQQWLAELINQASGHRPQATACPPQAAGAPPEARSPKPEAILTPTVSDAELGLIWRRSPGFVRQHKRRPFQGNMVALHNLDPAGFWLLISELDFRERLVKREGLAD